MLNLSIFLSGSGTTLQNLLNRIADGSLPVRITQVLSNRGDAFGLERARRCGIAAEVVSRKQFADTRSFSEALFEKCRQNGTDLVCLAGFLQLLHIPEDFLHRVMNIHPSLLPAFGGKGMFGHHVHEAVLNFGAKFSGCTVHFADNQFDHGPIILQRTCPVLDTDTPETLAARVFEEECVAYPEAINLFAAGRLKIDGRLIRIVKVPDPLL